MFYNLLIFAGGAERGTAAGKRTHNKPEKMKKGAMRVALQAIILAEGAPDFGRDIFPAPAEGRGMAKAEKNIPFSP